MDGLVRIGPEPWDRISIATAIHERAGHFGQRRIKFQVQGTQELAGVMRSVNKAIQQCEACGRLSAGYSTALAQLHRSSIEEVVFVGASACSACKILPGQHARHGPD